MENKNNIENFKRTKSLNYKMSFLAMMLTQALLFSFNLSLIANIISYVLNMAGWIVIGAVLECAVAVHYDVDLMKLKGKK